MRLIRKVALAASVSMLAIGAIAAASASAYTMTYSSGGANVAPGTTWAASGGALSFQNNAGTTIATCTGSTQSGVTADADLDGISDTLNLQAGSYSGCVVAGSPIFVTVNASALAPWTIYAVSGLSSPFTGEVDGVNVTVRCGTPTATPATYTGNLTSGVTLENNTAGSITHLVAAGLLTKSGTGCPLLPNPAKVTQDNTLTNVGGSAVSPTNNLWTNP